MFNKTIGKHIYTIALLIALCAPGKAFADHAAGGEIRYVWMGGNTYHFYFRFFRDCSGISAPIGLMLCYYNTCNGDFGSPIMQNMPVGPNGQLWGANLSTGCPGYPTTCQSSGSAIPGYQEFWYETVVTLPSQCHDWHFQVAISARNDNENIVLGSNLCLIATLDNLNFPKNSSPYFSVNPVSYVCNNQPFTFNNGAVDPDGDSLVFDVIQPFNGGGCPGLNNPIAFKTGNPAYNIQNNPFQTNNTFTLNSRTGAINFTPGLLGAHTLTVRVKEYRGQLLVGSVLRDLQVRNLNCTSPPVTLNLSAPSFNNSVLLNDEMVGCVGQQFSFCYDIATSSPGSILVASDNHTYIGSTAATTYTGQYTNKITGCFTFTAASADLGLKILAVTIKDSSCKPPGVIPTYTFTIPVRINTTSPVPVVTSPVYLCHNEPAQPFTATGKNILWYTAPTGGTGSATPIIPATTSLGTKTYYLTQNSNGCESPRIPVVADVQPKLNVDASAPEDSICQFDELILTDNATNATPANYSWDPDDGGVIISGDSTRQATAEWETPGWKNVVFSAFNPGCVSKDTIPLYIIRTPIADWDIVPIACLGQPSELLPAKEPEAAYKWTITEQKITDSVYKPVYKFTWYTLGGKNIILTLTNTYGCTTTKTDTIVVRESPKAEIINKNGYLCVGKPFTLETEFADRVRYAWTPPQYFSQNGTAVAKGTVEKSGYVYLSITNTWGCENVDSVFLFGGPCCEVFMPDAFSPNNDSHNDTYQPVDIEIHTLVKFMIVNRQGRIIFETNNPADKWDGNYKGVPQGLGTYCYYLKYICADNRPMEKKGNFILLR